MYGIQSPFPGGGGRTSTCELGGKREGGRGGRDGGRLREREGGKQGEKERCKDEKYSVVFEGERVRMGRG